MRKDGLSERMEGVWEGGCERERWSWRLAQKRKEKVRRLGRGIVGKVRDISRIMA
jgi:hypothetical protein